jgi:hypothetical protein
VKTQSHQFEGGLAKNRSGNQTAVPPSPVVLKSSISDKPWSALALADRIDTRLREIFAHVPGHTF